MKELPNPCKLVALELLIVVGRRWLKIRNVISCPPTGAVQRQIILMDDRNMEFDEIIASTAVQSSCFVARRRMPLWIDTPKLE